MKNNHIFYFDVLRLIAILCVVLLHVTGHLAEIINYNTATIFSLSGIFETFMNNTTKIGVDLFLLLSGALLLGRQWDIKEFLSKRIPRIVKPFIFWSLIFTILLFFASYLINSINFINDFTIFGFLKLFYDTLICEAPGSAVYWFFWMMFGVYLIMPVFNRWVSNSNLDEVEYFLVIWIVSTLFEFSLMQKCPIKLSYFTSPIGLVLLGYYLRNTQRKIFNNTYIALILTIAPMIIMLIYSLLMADKSILFEFHRYSILPIIEVTGLFCLFKSSDILNSPNTFILKITSSVAMCSYGMYLIHSQLIMVVRKIISISSNFIIEYLILFIVGFIGSWIIILVLSKIPHVDDWFGVK